MQKEEVVVHIPESGVLDEAIVLSYEVALLLELVLSINDPEAVELAVGIMLEVLLIEELTGAEL